MSTMAKNVLDEAKKQPRVTFFLGASMALGWDLNYEELFTLAEHTRSLVECFDVLEEMRRTRPAQRVQSALAHLAQRRELESVAERVKR